MNHGVEQVAGYPAANRLLALGLAAGMALGAAGCTPGEQASPNVSASAEAVTGPCVEPKPNDPNLVSKAQRCLKAMHGGKVLLVDFDAPPDTAQSAAAELPKILSTYTQDTVDLSFQVVAASPEAKKAYKATLAVGNCAAPNTDPAKYGGSIADKLMPAQTKGADFVLGITGAVPCKETAAGMANQTGGRYADVYMGVYKKELATGDKQTLEDVKRTGAMLTAHELMHLFGLGHAGTVALDSGEGVTDLSGNGVLLGQPKINLGTYLKNATYDQYSDHSNVMGSGYEAYLSSDRPTNKMDVGFLNWPKYATGQAENPAHEITAEETMLDRKSAETGQYAAVKLPQPFKLHSEPKADSKAQADFEPVKFTGLALVPLISKDANYGVEVVLTSGKTVASMGSLVPKNIGEDATSIVECAGVRLEVRTKGQQVFVRQLA